MSTRFSKQSTPQPEGDSESQTPKPKYSLSQATYVTYPETTHRPLPFSHPTHAVFAPHQPDAQHEPVSGSLHWSSRTSRKNRIAPRQISVIHRQSTPARPDSIERGLKNEPAVIEQRLHHPRTRLKVHLSWDISFWLAIMFTAGSALWVINGFLLYLPLSPSYTPTHANAGAWIAFVGGSAFEVGSYFMVVEALNAGHEQLFGPALWGLLESREPTNDENGELAGRERTEKEPGVKQGMRTQVHFRWIGTTSWRELGFLAAVVQFIAASVFWVSTITGLPGVIPNMTTKPPVAITDIFFWTPQVVGGTGFAVSSLLFMMECQRRWWAPNLASLGWHIGLWNLIGAVGFTLCGALGYASFTSSQANYQSVLATFWGSWAFMIGSVLQLYETLWREEPGVKDNVQSTQSSRTVEADAGLK